MPNEQEATAKQNWSLVCFMEKVAYIPKDTNVSRATEVTEDSAVTKPDEDSLTL